MNIEPISERKGSEAMREKNGRRERGKRRDRAGEVRNKNGRKAAKLDVPRTYDS